MKKNYWQEYWESYFNFMALYLSELRNRYPNADIKHEYTEVAKLFEPSMPPEYYEIYDEYDEGGENNNLPEDNDPPATQPGGGQSPNPFTQPGGGQTPNPFILPGGVQFPNPFAPPGGGQPSNPNAQPGGGQTPTPFISPGGGQFTINNCRRMAIVRIVMRRGFTPSEFHLIVDRADNRSIQGFRIACEGGRIRFVPMAVDYRNINFIECAF
ncbi:MAG: hypothetical protein ACLRSF_11185 [Romboutsia timonensis]|uniref:hypothetical protein n=2 Tax=Romboutsia timonensis TaxID=1776391 RepID=UPI0039909BE6